MVQSPWTDIRAWLAFLLGGVFCVLAMSYGEMRNEPSGLLVFDTTSTQPGMLKVLYTKDGKITDPNWTIHFPQGSNTSLTARYPLSGGQYDLIGFKPLVEAGGKVTIRNIKIISGSVERNISHSNFVAVNQLDKISSQNGDVVIAPIQDAKDPFGVFPDLHEIVPKAPFVFISLLQIASGKLALIVVFVMLIYGLSGSLPFALGLPNEPRTEPGLSQWLGLLAVGMIVLYLRNAHSLLVPVLYAEDGVWGAGLINQGFFDMLLNARPDYFVFGNVLLLALSQLTNAVFFGHNLTYLPYFTSLFSMLFYAGVAVVPVVLLRRVMRIEARLLLWLFILLVPLGNSSYEMLGRLANIGYAVLFLTFCLLVWRRYSFQDASHKQIIATDLTLFVCANTNPLCYPLIGVAFGVDALHHWLSNGRPRVLCWLKTYVAFFSTRSAIVLLATLFLTGLWITVRTMGKISPLDGPIVFSNVLEVIVGRTFLYPIIFPFYTHFNNTASGVLLLIAVITLALLAKGVQRERFILASAAVVLAVSAVITIVSRPVLTGFLNHYTTSFPDRYFMGLNLFVYLVLASALSAGFGADPKKWRRIVANTVAGALVALYAGNGAFMFEFNKPRFNYLPKTTFLDEVKKTYETGGKAGPNRRCRIALHPEPRHTYFPADYVTATVLGVRSVPRADADHYAQMPTQNPEGPRRYDEKVIRQKPAGRGREDGWFYVSRGVRSWIPDGLWLKQKNLLPADVIEITSEEFSAIPDSGEAVK